MDRTSVFVGYDTREHAAWLVCHDSLRQSPVDVTPLKHRTLRDEGLFDRPWRMTERGQMIDERDGKPFSTEFSHTRFLVPWLASVDESVRWAVFVDCDFLFMTPIHKLIEELERRNEGKVLYCVQHDFTPKDGVKMDGQVQQTYPRKLWSSLMVWDLKALPDHQMLCPGDVNYMTGGDMHRFSWLHDRQIGAIDQSWNWIPGHSNDEIMPDAVHWSLGGPWLPQYEQTAYASTWRVWYKAALESRLRVEARVITLMS